MGVFSSHSYALGFTGSAVGRPGVLVPRRLQVPGTETRTELHRRPRHGVRPIPAVPTRQEAAAAVRRTGLRLPHLLQVSLCFTSQKLVQGLCCEVTFLCLGPGCVL